jgi:hypothetical protein
MANLSQSSKTKIDNHEGSIRSADNIAILQVMVVNADAMQMLNDGDQMQPSKESIKVGL